MISGAEGPGRTDLRVSSGFGPMTTDSFRQMGDEELGGSPDGIVPGTSAPRGDEVRRVLGRAEFASKFATARRGLQRWLERRGVTPYFPEKLAGPLVDPILGSHRGTEEGLRLRRQVDIEAIDMNALVRKTGSRSIISALAEALGDASLDGRYIPINQYVDLVANAFMADPKSVVSWHFWGRGINSRAGENGMIVASQLMKIVEGAQLLSLGRSTQWRVGLGDVVALEAAASLNSILLTALTELHEKEQQPTIVKVLDTAVNALNKRGGEVGPGNNGGGSGGAVVGKMPKDVEVDPLCALKVRFRQITDLPGMWRPGSLFTPQPTMVRVGV